MAQTVYVVTAIGGLHDWNVKVFSSYVGARKFRDRCQEWFSVNRDEPGGPDKNIDRLGEGYHVDYEIEDWEVTDVEHP